MGSPAQPGMSLDVSERGASKAMATNETSSSAVAAREKASVEARFLVAISRPRDPMLARQRLMERCKSQAFAEVAEYKKPIGGGKEVTGGSIRLMEEIARHWGNVDVQSLITYDDNLKRIIRVSATDLESNYSQSLDVILEKTVERRNIRVGDAVLGERINSQNQHVYLIAANEDQFIVKQGANLSKARRECIRNIVPGDLVEEALDACFETRSNKDRQDPAAARKKVADLFFREGVMPDQLAAYLDKPSLETMSNAGLEKLRAIYTGIKEGETTWAEVMAEKKPLPTTDASQSQTGKGTSGLRDQLKKKADVKPTVEAPATEGSLFGKVDDLIKIHGSATEAFKVYQNSGAGVTLTDSESQKLAELADLERED